MGIICKGKCDEFRANHPRECLNHVKQKKFNQGWKWCKMCRIATKTTDKYCFCCGLQMRVRTHVRAVFEDRLPEPRVCAVCDGTKTYVTPRPAPFPLQEVRGLLGRADRVAERLVERDLAGAAVEVADVQPVEVAGRLSCLGGAAGLLGQLPRRDHLRIEAGQLRQLAANFSCPGVSSEELTEIDSAGRRQLPRRLPRSPRRRRLRASAAATTGTRRGLGAGRAAARRAGCPYSGEPGAGCTAGMNWTVWRWGGACRSTALNIGGPGLRLGLGRHRCRGRAAPRQPGAARRHRLPARGPSSGGVGGRRLRAAACHTPGIDPACRRRSPAGPRQSPSSASRSFRSRSTETVLPAIVCTPGAVDLGDDRDVLGAAERDQVAGPRLADRQDPFQERRVAVASEVQDRRDGGDRMGDLEPGRLQRVAGEDAAPGRAVEAEVGLELVKLRAEVAAGALGKLADHRAGVGERRVDPRAPGSGSDRRRDDGRQRDAAAEQPAGRRAPAPTAPPRPASAAGARAPRRLRERRRRCRAAPADRGPPPVPARPAAAPSGRTRTRRAGGW